MDRKRNGKIRVLIADDHTATREGIHALLQAVPDLEVIGEAQSGTEAQQMAVELCPDILLLDLVMPGTKPGEVEHWMREHLPGIPVLILTGHDRDHFLAQAIEAGVAGYLTKDIEQIDLVAAIRRAAQGESLLTGAQFARSRRWSQEVGARWGCLTTREQEVLIHLAHGKSNAEIAEALSIGVRTVDTHIEHILEKLDVASSREAIAWVWKHELLDGEEVST